MTGDLLLLCSAAFAAGLVNSFAGGGTLLTFPALVFVLSKIAPDRAELMSNATSTVAILPGSLASVAAYRREWNASRSWLALLVGPTLAGGLVGSLLVTRLPAGNFKALVPWMVFLAALLFAGQPLITRWLKYRRGAEALPVSDAARWGVALFQFTISIYGGYFGAGMGIMMLAGLTLVGLTDIHQINGIRAILGSSVNTITALVFVLDPPHSAAGGVVSNVAWEVVGPMAVAASLGGWIGAATARKINRDVIRRLVVVVAFSLAGYYFYQQFIAPAPTPTPPPANQSSGDPDRRPSDR